MYTHLNKSPPIKLVLICAPKTRPSFRCGLTTTHAFGTAAKFTDCPDKNH